MSSFMPWTNYEREKTPKANTATFVVANGAQSLVDMFKSKLFIFFTALLLVSWVLQFLGLWQKPNLENFKVNITINGQVTEESLLASILSAKIVEAIALLFSLCWLASVILAVVGSFMPNTILLNVGLYIQRLMGYGIMVVALLAGLLLAIVAVIMFFSLLLASFIWAILFFLLYAAIALWVVYYAYRFMMLLLGAGFAVKTGAESLYCSRIIYITIILSIVAQIFMLFSVKGVLLVKAVVDTVISILLLVILTKYKEKYGFSGKFSYSDYTREFKISSSLRMAYTDFKAYYWNYADVLKRPTSNVTAATANKPQIKKDKYRLYKIVGGLNLGYDKNKDGEALTVTPSVVFGADFEKLPDGFISQGRTYFNASANGSKIACCDVVTDKNTDKKYLRFKIVKQDENLIGLKLWIKSQDILERNLQAVQEVQFSFAKAKVGQYGGSVYGIELPKETQTGLVILAKEYFNDDQLREDAIFVEKFSTIEKIENDNVVYNVIHNN